MVPPHACSTDLRLESGLHRAFDRAVRSQLEPLWHTLGYKAKPVGARGGGGKRECVLLNAHT